jgi:hypothetical protein
MSMHKYFISLFIDSERHKAYKTEVTENGSIIYLSNICYHLTFPVQTCS